MAKNSSSVFIERGLIKSKAVQKLSGVSLHVYLIFLTKRQMKKSKRKKGKCDWYIANNNEIIFTYAEAKGKYGISNGRFTRAIDQLCEYGFLEIAEEGGADKNATLYFISEVWKKYGTPEFSPRLRRKKTDRPTNFPKNNTFGKNSKSTD